MKYLNTNNWERKEHFEHFKKYENPFFGLSVEIDATISYQRCKAEEISFFIYYLFCSIKAVNQTTCFRYRISNDRVVIHDRIDAAATVLKTNNTFGFSHIKYSEELHEFINYAQAEIEKVQNSDSLFSSSSKSRNEENIVHYSAIPWISFDSFFPAVNSGKKDSCPKMIFGKIKNSGGKIILPFSVYVHHALIDGWHLSRYMDLFQSLLNEE